MNLGQLLIYFDTSPAVRLLRSQHAPYITCFLFDQFKRSTATAIPHSELLASLAAWLDDVREAYPKAPRDRAEQYLTGWCSGESRWLVRRFAAGQDGPVCELSPHAEQVLGFLEAALAKDLGFVGTESRLHLVINTLEDLVVGASQDPALHLSRLKDERDRIDQQIAQIERKGAVAPIHPARIRERFATAVSLLKQLQGDFRAVEERFRQIGAEVRRRQAQSQESRGGILGDALDAEDALKLEDQGVSFFEFLRFIHSPDQQERVQAVVREVSQIPELTKQTEGLEAVRRMVPSLLGEAEKVTQTTRQLSSALRRLLDLRARRERQRVTELLKEIRGLAAILAEDPPRETVSLRIDAEVAIDCPMNRPFWSEAATFERIDLTEHAADGLQRTELFHRLARLQRINWNLLRGRIRNLIADRGTVTLGEILDVHPPEAGAIEVLGYLQIAIDDGNFVSRDAVEVVLIPARAVDGQPMELTVPLVTFVGGTSE